MAFMDKLLGRTSHVSDEALEAATDLAQLMKERPALAGLGGLWCELLPVVCSSGFRREEPPEGGTTNLTREEAAAKLSSGVPLLRGETVQLDVKAFRRRWDNISAIIQRHQAGNAGRAVADALRQGHLVPEELVQILLKGEMEAIHQRSEDLGLESGITAIVLRLTLFPVLASLNASLADHRRDTPWKKGYCPTCGSWPLLGEFRGLEHLRFLRCGLCAAEWEFPRLACPYCETADYRVLGYFSAVGEEDKHRAATCDACHQYVKMVSTLSALSAPRLLVADVATMHLDLAAIERGYSRP